MCVGLHQVRLLVSLEITKRVQGLEFVATSGSLCIHESRGGFVNCILSWRQQVNSKLEAYICATRKRHGLMLYSCNVLPTSSCVKCGNIIIARHMCATTFLQCVFCNINTICLCAPNIHPEKQYFVSPWVTPFHYDFPDNFPLPDRRFSSAIPFVLLSNSF